MIAKVAARGEAGAIMEHDHVAALAEWLAVADGVRANERGAPDAHERRSETDRHVVHRCAMTKRAAAQVQSHVVSHRLQPVDLVGMDEHDPATIPNGKAGLARRGCG